MLSLLLFIYLCYFVCLFVWLPASSEIKMKMHIRHSDIGISRNWRAEAPLLSCCRLPLLSSTSCFGAICYPRPFDSEFNYRSPRERSKLSIFLWCQELNYAWSAEDFDKRCNSHRTKNKHRHLTSWCPNAPSDTSDFRRIEERSKSLNQAFWMAIWEWKNISIFRPLRW